LKCLRISTDPEAFPYNCLSRSEAKNMLDKQIAELIEILPITSSQAKLILQLNSWNIDKISEEATENLDKFLIKNGLKVNPEECEINKNENQCQVCSEKEVELSGLDCGHIFCVKCWSKHINAEVEKSKSIFYGFFSVF
jgi:hypothetical protein